MKYPIASFFARPVDPELDGARDYHEKIKKPMDLGTVYSKLQENKYMNVEKWKEDMNLIWKNATIYNPEVSPIHAIAKELNEVFRRCCETIPKNEIDAWTYQVRKTHSKLMRLLESKPDLSRRSITTNAVKSSRPTKIVLRQKSQQNLG